MLFPMIGFHLNVKDCNFVSTSTIKKNGKVHNYVQCAVTEKIHTHPMEDHWKFLGGGGLKSQNFRSKV